MSTETNRIFTLTWKIFNYSSNTLKHKERFVSPTFHINEFHGTKWYLSLYPKGDANSRRFISCNLHRGYTDDCRHAVSVSITFQIIDSYGNVLKSSELERSCIIAKNNSVGIGEFLTVDQLDDVMKCLKKDTLMVRCHVIKNHTGCMPGSGMYKPVMCEAQTEVIIQKCEFRWKLKTSEILNWSKVIEVPFSKRPRFSITTKSPNENIHFEVKKIGTVFDFSFKLLEMLTSSETAENLIVDEVYKLEFLVLDDNGFQINLGTPTFSFRTTNGCPLFKFETSTANKSVKEVTFICSVSYANGNWISKFASYSLGEVFQHLVVPPLTLQEDLESMFLSKKNCDVKIRAENEIVPAHKYLLCARSPVFSAMFDQGMLESQTGFVDISDIEIGTLRSFLEFLYTDNLTNTESDHVLGLMLVADKYQVNVLKDHCCDILISRLAPDNVCDVISAAEMINHSKLKLSVVEYLKENRKKVLSTLVWTNWAEKNLKLSNDILSKILLD